MSTVPDPSLSPSPSASPSADSRPRHRALRRPRRLAAVGIGTVTALVAAGALVHSASASTITKGTGYNFGSGYSAINSSFTSVTANWIQPSAVCGGGNQQTGFWVGLSGAGTIAQTGTAANCNGTTPDYYAWWEMYPAAGVPMTVKTAPGDHIHASVTYKGNYVFTLTLANVTQGWTRTETETQASTGGTPTSANVIVEANSDNGDAGSSGNVTDFGSVTFGGATANGQNLGNYDLWTGNLQDMKGVQEDSVSALTSGRKFTATWLSTGG
jgi:hypothetical protein